MIVKYLLITSCIMLAACGNVQKKTEKEVMVGEGKISVLNTKRLLIQEKKSVVALDVDKTSGEYLSKRYKEGDWVKLMGFKTIDKEGNSREEIKAIIFEDGRRFNISG